MNTEQFDKVLHARLDKIVEVLQEKAKQYSQGKEDRLHHFNIGADFTKEPREKVLWGMMLKHVISVKDMIDDIEKGIIPEYSMVDEKIGDLINYGILLEACFIQSITEYRDKKVTAAKHVKEVR